LLNDRLYALEVHFVHTSIVDETQKAVLGVLFEAVSKPTPELEHISNIARMVANISNPSEFTDDLNLTSLLPTDPTRFYYYEGMFV
jgi:carbonic anhydrase